MNVDQPAFVAADEPVAQDAHEASQYDQVGRQAVNGFGKRRIECLALGEQAMINDLGQYAVRGGRLQTLGIGPVREHADDAHRQCAGCRRVQQRSHVAATPGDQDHHRRHARTPALTAAPLDAFAGPPRWAERWRSAASISCSCGVAASR